MADALRKVNPELEEDDYQQKKKDEEKKESEQKEETTRSRCYGSASSNHP